MTTFVCTNVSSEKLCAWGGSGNMSAEIAAPCRHAGAPPEAVVVKTVQTIIAIASDEAFLATKGLTPEEYQAALPAAIEALRGRKSASNADRRRFLAAIFEEMLKRGVVSRIAAPTYGDDTVYRLTIPEFGDIAIIQKGCPDGAHSSVRWSTPDWARKTYLWWLCSSLSYEPGEHVAKGVNRLRQRFFSEAPDTVDGIIFHNDLCGGAHRPCPKFRRAIEINGHQTPPPCIYVMPERDEASTVWNWDGAATRRFPAILMSLFGLTAENAAAYTGYVGFQRRAGSIRTTITSRFGPARSTTLRT